MTERAAAGGRRGNACGARATLPGVAQGALRLRLRVAPALPKRGSAWRPLRGARTSPPLSREVSWGAQLVPRARGACGAARERARRRTRAGCACAFVNIQSTHSRLRTAPAHARRTCGRSPPPQRDLAAQDRPRRPRQRRRVRELQSGLRHRSCPCRPWRPWHRPWRRRACCGRPTRGASGAGRGGAVRRVARARRERPPGPCDRGPSSRRIPTHRKTHALAPAAPALAPALGAASSAGRRAEGQARTHTAEARVNKCPRSRARGRIRGRPDCARGAAARERGAARRRPGGGAARHSLLPGMFGGVSSLREGSALRGGGGEQRTVALPRARSTALHSPRGDHAAGSAVGMRSAPRGGARRAGGGARAAGGRLRGARHTPRSRTGLVAAPTARGAGSPGGGSARRPLRGARTSPPLSREVSWSLRRQASAPLFVSCIALCVVVPHVSSRHLLSRHIVKFCSVLGSHSIVVSTADCGSANPSSILGVGIPFLASSVLRFVLWLKLLPHRVWDRRLPTVLQAGRSAFS